MLRKKIPVFLAPERKSDFDEVIRILEEKGYIVQRKTSLFQVLASPDNRPWDQLTEGDIQAVHAILDPYL
jgi:hypothetical protein